MGADDPTEGCFKSWDPPKWVDCWACFNCPSQPNNLGCYGGCDYKCGNCIKALYDPDDDLWEITVYNADGTIKGVITGITTIYATEHFDGHSYTRYHFE